MKRTLIAVLGLLLSGGVGLVQAQNPGGPPAGSPQAPAASGEVSGTVLDAESNTPIPRASVAVKRQRDSALVAGAMATADGGFRIQGLRPGVYSLRVISIGYGPRVQQFTIAPATPAAAVGPIKLSRVAVALQGVQVTGERATIAIEPDRNAYRAKDIAPAAGNASDVLDAVPSVQVDGDGKVSLRGNENVAVQINGRPSPITGTQLGAYLKGLPANIIDRIEVIPNPSAKYDPEGMAGIINIVLKQNTDLGYSAGVNAGIAESDRYNGSGNVGYQSGPVTTFSSLGINSDDRAVTGINDREELAALAGALALTNQDIVGRNGNTGQNFTTNVDYKLNPRDVFSNSVSVNHQHSTDASVSSYSEIATSGSLLDRYNRTRDNNVTQTTFDYTMALKRTFEPRKHELSSELRFTRTGSNDRSLLWRLPITFLAGGPAAATRLEGEDDSTDGSTKQLNAQLDYTRPLATGRKLETGYKGTARWIDRDFVVLKDALGTGQWVPSNLSNSFNFNEQVQAAYGVVSQSVGKFDLQAGLRAEYANRDFQLASQSFPHSYTSLFPSGIVLFKPDDASQIKVSYSRRIRRPGTQELNPFPSFFDVQNVFIGNPKLNPEYTDAYELGFSRSGALGSIQLSPFYRRTTDVIRVDINTSDVIDGREVTSVSFKNLATSNSWGSDLNGQLRLGKRFNGFGSFNVFKMVTDGGSQTSLSSDAVTWSARLNGTATLTPTLTGQASYFYRAPMNIERGRFASMQMATFSLRQKVYGDRGAVSLRAQDPFNTMRFKIKAGNDEITQLTERRFGVRGVFLTFQYNYGQTPKLRQPKQDQQPDSQTGFPPP